MRLTTMINTNNMYNKTFNNAQEAFEYYYNTIQQHGTDFSDTKALFNVGFTILNPLDNEIKTSYRKWNEKYAHSEWLWYLSGDPSINKLGNIYGKIPIIWKRMADLFGFVNSNYGYQWKRNDQLEFIIHMLKAKPDTRKASISIYDGKEITNYSNDTPCTYAVNFTIYNNKLNMSVMMRSNDLWFGFCNDQYCFSLLQKYVAERVDINVGTYFHFVNNIHLYNRNLNAEK
jgi:thymidylate synthase